MHTFPGPQSALFGHTGFVGTTLRRTLNFTHCFNSQNVDEARNGSFDVVVFCSMPAVKWLANKEPEGDMQVLQQLQDVLSTIRCKQFVLISTIDVYYPTDSGVDEDAALHAADNACLHAYGKHRALLEQFVRTQFAASHVIRLPALFGLHLRKNYVYDMLHANNLSGINRNSAFQWYDVSRLAVDIQHVLSLGMSDVNLFPEPVETQCLINLVGTAGALPAGIRATDVGQAANYSKYNICTKYGVQLGNPTPTSSRFLNSADEVCSQFECFLAEWKMMQSTTISCIAWSETTHAEVLELLKLQGVRFIEVAPTRFWSWDTLEAAHAAGGLQPVVSGLAAELERQGVQVSSLQAILYKKPDLCLFGSAEVRSKLSDHMRLVVDLVAALKTAGAVRPNAATPIVFGAPKNRQRPDYMTEQEADAIFVEVFRPLAEYAEQHGAVICLEPNAPGYGCNYITTSADARRLIEMVSHTGLRVHLDTGCMTMAGEDLEAAITACAPFIGHMHVSEPFLAHYLEPKVNHEVVARTLNMIGYNHMVSLELLTENMQQLRGSLAFYQQTYWPAFHGSGATKGQSNNLLDPSTEYKQAC